MRFRGRQIVEPCLRSLRGGLFCAKGAELPAEVAQRAAQLRGRPSVSPCQNGSRPGCPGAGETSTWSWVMSSIRQERGAEREHVADPRLVDHLLVELADPVRVLALALRAGQEHAEQPAVGDRAAAGDREPLGARAAAERARDAVPDQPRPQLGELVAGVAARQHVEHRVEHAALGSPRTGRPGGPAAPGRRPASRPSPPWRRSAGPARRAGCAGMRSPRSPRRASARRPPLPAPGRRGTWGRSRRGTPRRPGDRPGRSAAARWPPRAATRPG